MDSHRHEWKRLDDLSPGGCPRSGFAVSFETHSTEARQGFDPQLTKALSMSTDPAEPYFQPPLTSCAIIHNVFGMLPTSPLSVMSSAQRSGTSDPGFPDRSTPGFQLMAPVMSTGAGGNGHWRDDGSVLDST